MTTTEQITEHLEEGSEIEIIGSSCGDTNATGNLEGPYGYLRYFHGKRKDGYNVSAISIVSIQMCE